MKRIMALFMAISLCFAFAACSKKPVQSQIDNFSEKSNVELAIESVNTLLASKEYKEKSSAFEKATGMVSKAPKVTYVMEYQVDSFDGFPLHLLLINLEADFAVDGGFTDRTTLVVDLNNGSWCDEIRSDFAKWQNSFGGICKSVEDCYFLFLQPTFMEAGQSGSVFWSENETYSVLCDEELAQINAGLTIES